LAEAERMGEQDSDIDAIADRDALRRALDRLPPRERAVIVLRYFGGLSQQEVGRRLNISQMHVSRLQSRALERLRSVLGTR